MLWVEGDHHLEFQPCKSRAFALVVKPTVCPQLYDQETEGSRLPPNRRTERFGDKFGDGIADYYDELHELRVNLFSQRVENSVIYITEANKALITQWRGRLMWYEAISSAVPVKLLCDYASLLRVLHLADVTIEWADVETFKKAKLRLTVLSKCVIIIFIYTGFILVLKNFRIGDGSRSKEGLLEIVESLPKLWCLWFDANDFQLETEDLRRLVLTDTLRLGTVHVQHGKFISLDFVYEWLLHQAQFNYWKGVDYRDPLRRYGDPDVFGAAWGDQCEYQSPKLDTYTNASRNLQIVDICPTNGGEVTIFVNSKISCESVNHEVDVIGCNLCHFIFVCWKYVREYCPKPFLEVGMAAKKLDRQLRALGYVKIVKESGWQNRRCPCSLQDQQRQSDMYHEHVHHIHSLYERFYKVSHTDSPTTGVAMDTD
jgi:hypothetical protein